MTGEIRSPNHDQLVAELKTVREKGYAYLHRYPTPALTVVLQLYSADDGVMRSSGAVESLLRDALSKVGGGRPEEATGYTFGLVQGTRLWSASDRRKAAAKAMGVSVERFRKGYELMLIEQMADGILTLVNDRVQQQKATVGTPATDDDVQEVGNSLPRIADKLQTAGIQAFHLSRADYELTLAQFLEQATSNITIVSMSLKAKGAENEVLQLFRRALARSPQFQIVVSLIKPDSPACEVASAILAEPYDVFREEVRSMLADLVDIKSSLPSQQAARFYVLQHRVIPNYSGIIIDDGLPTAQLQTETKLYGAPRSDSYGFTLSASGLFYGRHRMSYYRIIRDAEPLPIGAEHPPLAIEGE